MLPTDWVIPKGVKLMFTTRAGGVSRAPFDSLNLGDHVGDSALDVQQNRNLLRQQLGLTADIEWLEQVHGTEVVNLAEDKHRVADGSYSCLRQQVCAVMTADCLPVLLCDRSGQEVAAVHAGWRGLCAGVIESALTKFNAKASDTIAYLGPAIGPQAFEVGAEVRQAFIDKHPDTANFFNASGDKYLADIQGIAQWRLHHAGVRQVHVLAHCTYENRRDYFSYRRESTTGRMASLIWLE